MLKRKSVRILLAVIASILIAIIVLLFNQRARDVVRDYTPQFFPEQETVTEEHQLFLPIMVHGTIHGASGPDRVSTNTPSPTQTPYPTPTPESTPTVNPQDIAFFETLKNSDRQQRSTMNFDPDLYYIGFERAWDMIINVYFDHCQPEEIGGLCSNDIARLFEYLLPTYYPELANNIESIACGGSYTAVKEAWDNSPGHDRHVNGTNSRFFQGQTQAAVIRIVNPQAIYICSSITVFLSAHPNGVISAELKNQAQKVRIIQSEYHASTGETVKLFSITGE